MNREQFRYDNQAIQRRYEVKFYPKVVATIQRHVDESISIVKRNGPQSAINHLNLKLSDTKLTEIVQTMALEVGLQFARRTWKSLQEQRRAAKPQPVKSFGGIVMCGIFNSNEGQEGIITKEALVKLITEKKGFGFNDAWVAWIKRYLFDFIVEKITFSVFETTKDTLTRVLSQAITEGWGVAETVKNLEELPLPKTQAARIVRTEITRAANAGTMAAGDTFPFEQNKEWIAAHDTRTRGQKPKDHASHIGLDGRVIDYEDVFVDPINGDYLRFPGDPLASAESVINCRCSIAVVAKIGINGRLIPKQINQAA